MRASHRIARCAYAAAARVLLPGWLRDRIACDLIDTFDLRLEDAAARNHWWRELAREMLGLCRTAVVVRLSRRRAVPSIQPREQSTMLDNLVQDVRFALRSMQRNRLIATLAVSTLALGVGASSAMFSVIDAVLLRPLPFDHPGQIMLVNPTIDEWRTNPSLSSSWQRGRFSDAELREWLSAQRSFVGAAGYSVRSSRVLRGGGSDRVSVAMTTDGFWRTLGVHPLLGRLPTADDHDSIAVVTHAFWMNQLGGDSSIIGRSMRLDDRPVRVVAVLRPDFVVTGIYAAIWRPMVLTGRGLGNHSLAAIGRLRPRVSILQAEDEMTRILRGVDAVDAKHITHSGHIVSPVQDATRDVRLPLIVLATASVVLLLAACANVALLLLGVGVDRARELAVRQALGARKSRIVGQLFVESLSLTVFGSALGLLVATGGMRVLRALAPKGVPRMDHVSIDLRTFALGAVLAILTGLLVGCAPAFTLSKVDAGQSLRAGGTTAGTGKLQRGIVAAELALATVLLVGAGLLTRTMAQLQAVNPGFDPDGLFTVRLVLPWDVFYVPGANSDSATAALSAYIGRIGDAVRSVPGVTQVAMTSDMPYTGDRGTNSVEPEGYTPAPGEVVDVGRRFVTGNYFDVMRIHALQGRLLTAADANGKAERVMVVSDEFAKHFWPDRRWIGRTVGFWGKAYRVVGVIGETHEHDLRGDDDKYKFYVPATSLANVSGSLLLRTSTLPAQLEPVLRERIWGLDRSIVIENMMPMRDRMALTLASDRYRTVLMSVFSVTAAFFSLLGIYGVMSRAVARRRREIGVRRALGAPRGSIVALVLADAARIGFVGALIGVALATVASRVLGGLIWGVPRVDPITYVGSAALLMLLTLVAAGGPARRATRVDLMGALRN